MIWRVISSMIGRPGLRRRIAMVVMRACRRRRTIAQPDLRFVRTLQSPDQVIYDAKLGQWRPSSAAFGPSSSKDKSLSGDLEELLAADGLAVDALYPAVDRAVGACSFTIEQARALGVEVGHDPVWTNWYHGGARFPGMSSSAVSRAKKKLRDAAVELVAIDAAAALHWYQDHNGGSFPQGYPTSNRL